MHERDDRDPGLTELFSAARRADLAELPDFQQTVRQARKATKEPVAPGRLLRVGLLTVAGGTATALASFWLLVSEPAPSQPDGIAPPRVSQRTDGRETLPSMPIVPPVDARPVDHRTAPADEIIPSAQATPSPPPPRAASSELSKRLTSLGYVASLVEEAGARLPAVPVAEAVPIAMKPARVSFSPPPPPYRAAPERQGELTAPGFDTESYEPIGENAFLSVLENPLSTFSIDVDTASYTNVRRFLREGRLPPRDAVRIEELINYFEYDYPRPIGDSPLSASVEVADCPWAPAHRLARIGLAARELDRGALPGSNLVFLIDVSGSMAQPAKLPLLQSGLSLLVRELDARDQVAIVVYAGASGVVLPSTSGERQDEILDALERLRAGGSTNGAAGLELAYATARERMIPGGVNRVVLATDGDFNVGVTSRGELLELIEREARTGIFLTVLGFGMGNYKDDTLELLADRGNGNYAYIDTIGEARRVLVEQAAGTLVTVAKDVKIQVEFNPAEVGAYRLIGYENRLLAKEDFNDDHKDAGEIGAGHTVTALYELVPRGVERDLPAVDGLKYMTRPTATEAARSGELFTVKLRYKQPEVETSRLIAFPVTDDRKPPSDDFKFAAAVAGFGMLLRDSPTRGDLSYESVAALARAGLGPDDRGRRAELLELVARASADSATRGE